MSRTPNKRRRVQYITTSSSQQQQQQQQHQLASNPQVDEQDETLSSKKDNQEPGIAKTISNSDHLALDLIVKVAGPQQTKQNTDNDAPQRELPNELVYLILNHCTEPKQNTIYECTLVNKQFYAIATPLLWKTLAFGNSRKAINFFSYWLPSFPSIPINLTKPLPTPPQALGMMGQYIHNLPLNHPFWTNKQLVRMTPFLGQLTRVSLNVSSPVSHMGFRHLPLRCHSHLTSIHLDRTRLTKSSFAAIGKYCKQLANFSWTPSKHQPPEWLAMLAPCPLTKLHYHSHFKPIDPACMTLIKTHFTQLTRLKVEDSSVYTIFTGGNQSDPLSSLIHDNGATSTSTTAATRKPTGIIWPHLTKLTLTPCDDVTEQTFVAFLQSHPNLYHLYLSSCYQLTDRSLDAMARYLPKLQHISLFENSKITPDGIRQLIRSCPGLKEAEFIECRNVKINHFPEIENSLTSRNRVGFDQAAMDKIKQKV